MCIIAYKAANQKLKKEILENCYKANGDGCGFAYPHDGAVVIEKGQMEFEDFWNKLDAVQNQADIPMIVHFRRRSAGDINDSNCHPFRIDARHAMVHNGTLFDFTSPNSPISDTARFSYHILEPMFAEYPHFFKTKYGRHCIEKTIGSSKIVILNADGEYVIFNESAGEWDDNIWYSNKSYLPPPPKKEKKQKHNHKNFRYNGPRKKKPKAYVALLDILHIDPENKNADICIEKGDVLTQQDISTLTHHYKKQWRQRKCKLKNLVYNGIIGPAPEDQEVMEMVQ